MFTTILNTYSRRWPGVHRPGGEALQRLSRALDDQDRPVLFWRSPDGTAMLAMGEIERVSLASVEKWRAAFRESAGLIREKMSGDGPAFFLIFFDPQSEPDGRWRDFSQQFIFFPKIVEVFERFTLESQEENGASLMDAAETHGMEFRATLDRVIAELATGSLEKIVLAQERSFTASRNVDVVEVVRTLIRRESECTIVLFSLSVGKAFVCATPEHLAVADGGSFFSEAVAGTDAPHIPSLDDNGKIDDEHRHVLETIAARAHEFCSDVRIMAREIRSLRNVRHRVTPIRGTFLEGRTIIDAVATLHPTPAVCGVPERAALDRIREMESFSRGLYAGAIGWMDKRGNGETVVAIRSALIDRARVSIFAGAGLVHGSDAMDELRETQWKMEAMMTAIEAGRV